jgi:curved DNA-binding protein CbpA
VNPYEILGVDRDASIDDIKRAYRQNAMKMHPDHGGSEEDMKRLTEARDILIDPKRRQRFDEFGETDDQHTLDAAQATVSSMLADAFAQDSIDPIRWICDRLDGRRSDARLGIEKQKKNIERLSKKIERFKSKNEETSNVDGRDFIVASLQSGISQFQAEIDRLETIESESSEALVYLNDLSCPPESPGGCDRSIWGRTNSVDIADILNGSHLHRTTF